MKPAVNRRRYQPPERQYYSVHETAHIFGMSAAALYRTIKDGEFPAVRIRGRVFVPKRAVDEMRDSAVASQGCVEAADWVPNEEPDDALRRAVEGVA